MLFTDNSLTRNGVVLGQETVNKKTNEIPVMQEMLKYIDLQGKVITADALNCQKDTAALIIKGGGDYILGLKGNQGTLHYETTRQSNLAKKRQNLKDKSITISLR